MNAKHFTRSKAIAFFFFLTCIGFLAAGATCALAENKKSIDDDATGSYLYDPFEDKRMSPENGCNISDPLESYNRCIFVFNDKLYFWVLKPAAQGYMYVMPEPARRSVKRFFLNLATPMRLVNCLLQAKFSKAGIELYRFSVNSTVGLAGLFDPAHNVCGLNRYDEDTGQTLGLYGIGHGIFIVWPVLGPSSIRETFGTVGDMFLDPLFYVNMSIWGSAGIEAFQLVGNTSFKIGEYEDFKKSAIDPYTSLKNAYVQYRDSLVKY
ncbi:MAG: VacJ family lipoprotein [Pseudomonadota bacterium]